MTTFINSQGVEIEVFVHEIEDVCGTVWAVVNKGATRSYCTFRVIASRIHGLVL